ncbi:MAG: hypothetical protein WBF53_16890 [Litorimonas sp.]
MTRILLWAVLALASVVSAALASHYGVRYQLFGYASTLVAGVGLAATCYYLYWQSRHAGGVVPAQMASLVGFAVPFSLEELGWLKWRLTERVVTEFGVEMTWFEMNASAWLKGVQSAGVVAFIFATVAFLKYRDRVHPENAALTGAILWVCLATAVSMLGPVTR